MSPMKVLVTGVNGLVGNVVYGHLAARPDAYQMYGLARRRGSSARIPEDQLAAVPENRLFLANLRDMVGVQQAVQGMDAVVHMAANPNPDAPWESVLNDNIAGTYNILEASRLAGAKRVILASSVMVAFGYALDEPYKAIHEARFQDVPADVPIVDTVQRARPTALYSASKVWSEAVGHLYAYRHGLSCICIRIGWVVAEDRPPTERSIGPSTWCSQRDIAQLVEKCLLAPAALRYDIFFGLSNNRYNWVDVDHARQVVGYEPQDSAEDWGWELQAEG